jgi:AcrR family transcriptional regulator
METGAARIGRVASAPLGLPRGRSSIPASEVRAQYEDRLLHAMVAVVADRGYAAVTVSDVLAAARVSRAGFYSCFPGGKEECFLTACRMGGRILRAHIRSAVRAQPEQAPVDEVLRASIRAYLEFLTLEPAFARVFMVDMLAAGGDAAARYARVVAALAADTAAWHRSAGGSAPEETYELLASALAHTAALRIRRGDGHRLLELEEAAVELHLRALAT